MGMWVALLVVTVAGAARPQDACINGRAVSLSLSHHTNSSGHMLLNGHMEQPTEGMWHLDVDLRTSTCGAARSSNKVLTFALTGSSVKARVPPGYELREEFGYFRLGTHALNWTAARDACAREGAHLAFAQSQEEAVVLSRFNFAVTGTQVRHLAWYGASDIVEKGNVVTVTGVILEETGYASYHPRHPTGRTNHNCICIDKENALLFKGPCPEPLAFVCKISL